MTKETLRIVYMGTPDFAVESLKALVEGGYNVVGVVTMPDKPMGRHGSVLQPSPVKVYAQEHGLTILQPERLKDEAFLQQLSELNADLQIVVAFRMLPEVVWNMPVLGTFNLHASLLPQYRGAAPINWAVINGEKETGITTFFLKHEIDTGEIIQQVKVPINESDNVEDVHDRLMSLGASLVVETVDKIIDGTVKTVPQELFVGKDVVLKPAPKIFHDTCQIHWESLSLEQAYNFIRGLSPYPGSWTTLHTADKNIDVKILAAEKQPSAEARNYKCGAVVTDNKSFLKVAVEGGFLNTTSLQLSGKKRMPVADVLRGLKLDKNTYFC